MYICCCHVPQYQHQVSRVEEKVLGSTFIGKGIFLCDRRKCNRRNHSWVYRKSRKQSVQGRKLSFSQLFRLLQATVHFRGINPLSPLSVGSTFMCILTRFSGWQFSSFNLYLYLLNHMIAQKLFSQPLLFPPDRNILLGQLPFYLFI